MMQRGLSAIALFSLGLLTACGGGGSSGTSSTDSNSIDSATAFPAALALTSPTGVSSSISVTALKRAVSSGPSYSAYVQATEELSGVLSGSVTTSTAFDKESFLQTATNANCFGPSLLYSGHPDAGGGSGSGALPGGDLGIWSEYEDLPSSGQTACAAAQIDKRMQGVSERTQQALITFAALINAANDAGIAAPSAGSSVDLASALGASLSSEGVTVSGATLSLDAGGTTWDYGVDFSFTGSDGNDHQVVVQMQHTPGASGYEYEGLISYQVDDDWDTVGNCATTTDRTYNGTVYYKRSGQTEMQINAREGMYCGFGTTGAKASAATVTGGTSYQLLDPATKHGSSASGWSDNFSIFGAVFDPTTTEGKYTYAWQAGENDNYARTFSIGINYDTATGRVDGEAYYGFASDIGSTDGAIKGFFCNWAGPGTRTLQPYAQRQSFQFDSTAVAFDVPAGGSDITYAPRDACSYGPSDTAGFLYDRNLNQDLSDETANTTYVDASSTLGLDLMDTTGATDLDGDSVVDIFDKMLSRGWVQPPI